VTIIDRLDAVRERWNVLRHPFYRRWSAGLLDGVEARAGGCVEATA
jgi:hypothetical protein